MSSANVMNSHLRVNFQGSKVLLRERPNSHSELEIKVTEIGTFMLTLSSLQTNTDTFANSADSDKITLTSRLIWIYTVCLSVIDL